LANPAIPDKELRMHRLTLPLLLFCAVSLPAARAAEKDSALKFASPDKRFALRIAPAAEGEYPKAQLIEKASGKMIVELGEAYRRQVLVWSNDSKWFAYCNRGEKSGDLSVYFWNGTGFDNIDLPEDLPSADPKVPDSAGGVKNYGGAVEPLRWSKPGELQLLSDSMLLGRDDGHSYTGEVRFTLSFDAQHHASIKNVGKTKTKVSK
jgi:hypothetical protein